MDRAQSQVHGDVHRSWLRQSQLRFQSADMRRVSMMGRVFRPRWSPHLVRAALVLALMLPMGAVMPSPTRVSAAPGDLDPTFGSGGIVITNFGGNRDHARRVDVLPDGK